MIDDATPPDDRTAPQAPPPAGPPDRLLSYGLGAACLALGVGFLVWYDSLVVAPRRLFFLLGGFGPFLAVTGLGLVVSPLSREQLRAMRATTNPVVLLRTAPGLWKVWTAASLAAALAGLVYVMQTTERVGR